MKLLVLFIGFFLSAPPQDVNKIRLQFQEASFSQAKAVVFYESLKDYQKDDPSLIGYKAAALALNAKYSSNRRIKKDDFTAGAQLLEQTIKSNPKNVELRVIRLSIQENTPKLLKYKANISEDKALILQGYKQQNTAVKQFIRDYSKHSKAFTDLERNQLTP